MLRDGDRRLEGVQGHPGSAYGIHIIERWDHERRLGNDARAAVEKSVGNTGLPVFLAMATTVAGFGSNFVMNILSIRAFSVFSALGIIFSFVLALTFVPAVLALVRPKRGSLPGVPDEERRRNNWFAGWGGWAFRHRWGVVAGAAGLTLFAGAAGRSVRPSTDFARYFKAGSKPARAADIVNQRFGGMASAESAAPKRPWWTRISIRLDQRTPVLGATSRPWRATRSASA